MLMLEKNLEREKEKFQKAKQQWTSSRQDINANKESLEQLKKENERLKKQLAQKTSDIKKLTTKGGEHEDGYKKLFDDAQKQIKRLKTAQMEQNKKINKQQRVSMKNNRLHKELKEKQRI